MVMAVAFDGTTTASGYTVSGYEHGREQAARAQHHARLHGQRPAWAKSSPAPATKLWQDRANHLVWFKLQGGLPYPNEARALGRGIACTATLSVVLRGANDS